MSDLGPPSLPSDVGEFFRAERDIPEVSQDTRGRLLAGLITAGAVGLAVTGVAEAAGATAAAASSATVGTVGTGGAHAAGLLARLLASRVPLALTMFALGGAGGSVLSAKLRSAPAPLVVIQRVAAPVARTVPAEAVAPAVAPEPVALPVPNPVVAPAAVQHPAARTVAVPAEDPLARAAHDADGRLVDTAAAALNRGDFTAAADALRQGDERYPHSEMADERGALWVRTLVAEGRYAEARARAAAFHRTFPASLQRATVEAALAAIPDGE